MKGRTMERWIATITFGGDGMEPSRTKYYSVRAETRAEAHFDSAED
jgi:hypothetical protein